MPRFFRIALYSLLAASLSFANGCTSKVGDRKLNSRYVYAQSTVTPLRNVTASASRTKLGISCGFTREEYESVYDEALAQDPSANVLLDYSITYDTTLLPFFCITELTISGLAAVADVR